MTDRGRGQDRWKGEIDVETDLLGTLLRDEIETGVGIELRTG